MDAVKQKIVEDEMSNLLGNIGKKVTVNTLSNKEGKVHNGILGSVQPYKYIGLKQGGWGGNLPFIGAFEGITKITEKETGNVLYENTTINFSEKNVFDDNAVLAEMNKLREIKYGSTNFNSKDLMD